MNYSLSSVGRGCNYLKNLNLFNIKSSIFFKDLCRYLVVLKDNPDDIQRITKHLYQ